MKKRIPIYLLLAAVCSLGSFVAEAVGTATVVRAHPRLTRGLEKESLIGIRFDDNYGGAPSTINLHFDFKNCNRSVIKSIEVWYQKSPAYAFSSDDEKNRLLQTSLDSDDLEISDLMQWIYPKNQNNLDSDYLWIVAAIDPEIPATAEIRVSITNTEISLGENKYNVANGTAQSPHRVFPYYYHSGAYFRADRVTGTSCAPLEDVTAERLQSLNDLIIINDLEPVYDEATDSFSTTWNTRRDNSAGVAYVKGLRDAHHPQAMVRLGLTKNDTKMTKNGETAHPLAFAVSTPKYRQQLIAAIVSVMEATGVDGLDVDWEYPGVNSGTFTTAATWERDWHNYGLFLRDLAEAFFNRGWVLSMCTNLGWTMPSDATMSINRAKFSNVLHVPDYIDSMAYGDETLNASPMVMQKAIKVITDCGVPNRRIVVGQAMYAYEVQNPGWGSVVNWLAEAYPESRIRRWDADLVWKHREATRPNGTVVTTEKETFEGPSSYHAKVAWCCEHVMGGAMSWGYYTDVDWNRTDLMSLGRHHAKSLPMIANLPTAPERIDGFYQIATEADWNWLAKNGGVSARLTADITFTYDPMMITEWNGTLDGQGHTITIPTDVWIAHEGSTGLFGTIRNGTVKNLTIDLKGRVLTRASRWNDTTVAKGSTASKCPDNVYVGVLAAEIRANSKLENVTINLDTNAEVQGVYRTGTLAGNVYAPAGAKLEISNCKVVANGVVQNLNINSSETVLDAKQNAKVDALVGHVQQPTGATTVVFSQTFALNADGTVSLVDAQGAVASKSQEAYLLNCDDSASAIAEKKDAFKFTADDLEKLMKGVKLTTINGVEFNGKLTILGASALDGEWRENLEGAKFFKAVLTLE